MSCFGKPLLIFGFGFCLALIFEVTRAAEVEYNPARIHPVAIGPEATRLIVGFRATSTNAVTQSIANRRQAQAIRITQAQTTAVDLSGLALRAGVRMARSRQLTPSMHVLYLREPLYGADVQAALGALRADPAVQFAEVDQRRYPHAPPNDPLYRPTPGASGQWYLGTPSAALIIVNGVPTQDISATDAVSAWAITVGSKGTVIADLDTGVRFDHPDLLRAGQGGRLLPGYDFVNNELTGNGTSLGTSLIANDGDGWDPDPSDPGDWIDATDQKNTTLFPKASCPIADSSWHGTRVVGILGALTDNNVGIAGMTWNPYILPVRVLGKCGGYDSDIIKGMQWAAGLHVNGVPDNPYPADIVNLSLGGSGACGTAYASAIPILIRMGVLVVASAGNGGAAVDSPGNCAGVLAVAGLRNVGTKVGYSSSGKEVGIAAPAGNCVSSGACLRPIDTVSNAGLKSPGANIYTDQTNSNVGTSFSAPLVAGVAALMRAVNGNLTPEQLIARLKSSATVFPQPAGVLVCPNADPNSGECACPRDGSLCGAGMLNALNAVKAAQKPIAAVVLPTVAAGSNAIFDARGSAASCGRNVASYAWSTTGAVTLVPPANAAQVTVTTSGAGTLTLLVTDSVGDTDTATVNITSAGASSTAPAAAGTAAGSCPAAIAVTAAAPTVSALFTPASVGENAVATLDITLTNANGFDLTQAGLTVALPANLVVAPATASTVPASTCMGAAKSVTTTTGSVTLSNAIIPTKGSCILTLPVQSAMAGSYTLTVAANALKSGPAGPSAAPASATLTVTAPAKGGGGVGWPDLMFLGALLWAGAVRPPGRRRRRARAG